MDTQGLHVFAETNDIEGLEKWLKANSSKRDTGGFKNMFFSTNPLEACDEQGNTPLITAAYYGNLSVLKALIEARANVNARDEDGNTPLIVAADKGHPSVVRALIAEGAVVAMYNKHRYTPLLKVASSRPITRDEEQRKLEMLRVLIDASENVNAKANGLSALFYVLASYKYSKFKLDGYEALIKTLKEKGAELDAAVLHCYVQSGDLEGIQACLNAGVSLDAHNGVGDTPLTWLVRYCLEASVVDKRLEIMKALVAQGADVNASSVEGCTPLFYATSCSVETGNPLLPIVEFLEEKGARSESGLLYYLHKLLRF